jgi:hypothetical protein
MIARARGRFAQGGLAQGGLAQGGLAQGGLAEGGLAEGGFAEGRFTLGRWAWPVSVVAAAYLGLMLADLVAPTGLDNARAYFNDDWVTLMVMAVVALIGVIVFFAARRGREIGEHLLDGDVPAAAEPVPVPGPGTGSGTGSGTGIAEDPDDGAS